MIANLTIIGRSRDIPAQVKVQVNGENITDDDVTIRYQEAVTVGLPDKAIASSEDRFAPTVRLVSSSDVTVRCIVGYERGTHPGDGFLVLPVSALDTEYVIATAPPLVDDRSSKTGLSYGSEFTVSAVYDNTSIDIKATNAYTIHGDNVIPPNVERFLLDRHQSVQVRSPSDLTGTRVTGSGPIAVVSGNDCATIPGVLTTQSCYYLVEQMVPTSSWGKSFLVAAFKHINSDAAANHIVRSVCRGEETHVTFIDYVNVSVTISSDQCSYDYLLSGNDVITIVSDRPIMVVQYVEYIARGYGGKQVLQTSGAMIVVTPEYQYVRRAVMAVPQPKESASSSDNILFPILSYCVLINCSYVDTIYEDDTPLQLFHSSIRVSRGAYDACAIERKVDARAGDVITISSSSSSARMLVSVQGFYDENVNYLYSAAQRVDKFIGDLRTSEEIVEGMTTRPVSTEYPSDQGTKTYLISFLPTSELHKMQTDTKGSLQGTPSVLLYLCFAGSGTFCLIAVLSLILLTRKW